MKRLPYVAVLFFLCLAGCENQTTVEQKSKTVAEKSKSFAQTKSTTAAVKWGTLKGRFVFDGKAPTPAPLAVYKDKVVCCDGGCPMDESLLIDKKTSGVANVVVYLRSKLESEKFIHPSYKKTEKNKIQTFTRHCQFVPHIVAMRTTQTLVYTNKDKVGHFANLNLEHG